MESLSKKFKMKDNIHRNANKYLFGYSDLQFILTITMFFSIFIKNHKKAKRKKIKQINNLQ